MNWRILQRRPEAVLAQVLTVLPAGTLVEEARLGRLRAASAVAANKVRLRAWAQVQEAGRTEASVRTPARALAARPGQELMQEPG
jgi:hypothetical protein